MAGSGDMIDARLFPPEGLPRVKRDQHRKLEERFRECRNPTGIDITLIAAEVGLTDEQTTVRVPGHVSLVTWAFQHECVVILDECIRANIV